MRLNMALVVGVVLVTVIDARAQDADTNRLAMAEELLDVINMPGIVEQTFANLKAQMPLQLGLVRTEVGATNLSTNVITRAEAGRDSINEELSWNRVKAHYIAIYATRFTAEEMKDIIAILKTPTGQNFARQLPELIRETKRQNLQIIKEVGTKVRVMVEDMRRQAAEESPVSGDSGKKRRIPDTRQ